MQQDTLCGPVRGTKQWVEWRPRSNWKVHADDAPALECDPHVPGTVVATREGLGLSLSVLVTPAGVLLTALVSLP